jgi:hypothetical protein
MLLRISRRKFHSNWARMVNRQISSPSMLSGDVRNCVFNLAKRLNEHSIEYCMIGDVAMNAHGYV